jgi:8-oxo-dGTP pyrophosphatase MutT (NUDIX family)
LTKIPKILDNDFRLVHIFQINSENANSLEFCSGFLYNRLFPAILGVLMSFSSLWKLFLLALLCLWRVNGEVYHIPPSDFSSKMIVSGCFCESNGKFLLLLRGANRSWGNTWCLPAGKIFLSESPIAACVRQMKQETGILLAQEDLSLFRKFYVRLPDKDFELYLFEAKLAFAPGVDLNLKEYSAFKWVSITEAFSLPLIPGADVYMKLRSEKNAS